MPDSLSELDNGRTVVRAQIAQLGFERNAEHLFVGSRLKQSNAIAWGCCPPQRVHTQVTPASWPVLFDCE